MPEKILMCKPDFYGIKYEINPWMNMNVQADNKKALLQWENLYLILKERLGVDIELIAPHKDVPDMVFTANAAVIYNKSPLKRKSAARRNKPAVIIQKKRGGGVMSVFIYKCM